ncbi:MAG: cupin domain-containing protein [Solirubrobacterales bacterium]
MPIAPLPTTPPRQVEKPWGYEIWWAHNEHYVGKLLHVEAGHRLSLQMHREKDETSYVLSGRILLTRGPSLDQLTTEEVGPGFAWRAEPGTIHSLEALEDSDIIEASTPQVDDVVRLQDRYGREGQ